MIGVQELWGWQVALYLFLGGLGGGVFVVSSAISLTGRKRYRRLCRAGYWVALLCVVGGVAVSAVRGHLPLSRLMFDAEFCE